MNNVKPMLKGVAFIIIGAVAVYLAYRLMTKGVESMPKVKDLANKITG